MDVACIEYVSEAPWTRSSNLYMRDIESNTIASWIGSLSSYFGALYS